MSKNTQHDPRCGKTIEFKSDLGGYGRAAVFYCQLDKGHDGKHKESVSGSSIKAGKPYTITWEGK